MDNMIAKNFMLVINRLQIYRKYECNGVAKADAQENLVRITTVAQCCFLIFWKISCTICEKRKNIIIFVLEQLLSDKLSFY
jgi:hypothetical protein